MNAVISKTIKAAILGLGMQILENPRESTKIWHLKTSQWKSLNFDMYLGYLHVKYLLLK